MRCPDCGHPFSRVLRAEDKATHEGEEYISRRRECRRCRHRWTTFETQDLPDLDAAFRIQEALHILDQAKAKLALSQPM
ncbi:MAG: Transcriptional repressor NrdR [bacterium]|nr:Transcriptional repressor NrdR [bacterium]